jgi:subtilisin
MATSKRSSARRTRPLADASPRTSSTVEEMLLAAQASGSDSMETGRFIVTFKEGAVDEGIKALRAQSMRTADARDFADQSVQLESLGDADALVFPEIGAAVVGAAAAQERGMSAASELAADDALQIIEPEYFVFPEGAEEYLRGFLRAAETIARDIGAAEVIEPGPGEEAEVLGNTWGLAACRVPASLRNGTGIKVAVLDTGFAIGHPDFAGRPIIGSSFVGQPVQDLHGHGTHCIGTALGPQAPAGATPRYGIAFRGAIFVGKVLSNSGGSVGGSVLAGMNWAIANRCEVISMSLGGAGPVQAAYTAAGQAALQRGLLIVAAAGNGSGAPTGYPANSPTIMSVASLDPNLRPSSFSNRGKVEIAAPGRDVFSAAPMPRRYATMNGTSMATPHVAGCAALPFPSTQVGAGLVQAP